MRNLSLAALAAALAGFCMPAMAGWVYLASNDHVTAYVNPQAISNSGSNTVKVWSLSDLTRPEHSDPTDKNYLSTAAESEFDCSSDRARLLTYRWYAGNMGKGEVVYAGDDVTNWEAVEPDTLYAALYSIACGQR